MKRTALSAAAVIALMGAGAADAATTQQLEQKLDAMAAQIDALRAELKDVRAQNAALASQQQTQAKAQAQQGAELQTVQQTVQTAQLAQAKPSPLDNLTLWGYGEANYSRPTRRSEDSKADLARAVFGIGYRFNDKTRFNSEFEIEHGVTSSSDVGEFEVEQFYIDHKLTDKVGLNAGLFLIPTGFINRNHEPTNYYGVHRNFVETLIIPSTWREGGLSLYGDTDIGLNWNVGLTTGLDLAKWNFNPENPLFSSALEMQNNAIAPMQTSHQELGLANARNLSQYVALNYTGIPGVTLGGSVFTGKSSRASTEAPLPDQRATLYEAHARWTPGKWDLSALYAYGTFSNTAAVNLQNPGAANPMPAAFYGWYVQAAYNVWQKGDYRVAPFVRYERYNMGSKYEGLAPGFTPVAGWPALYDTVYTIGANFYLNPNVVFKIDYQRFTQNRDFSRVDLGLGVSF
ncbi:MULTISPECIES: porin [Ralstonia solanacearum species complex]|uniref:Porin n=1 Tax=Ralstonia syzygii TaxID=28097 RepID=A0ABX7ZKL0_9RALS|nr:MULTISPECIES: porin [Ralstonia solanacearum species complex]AMP39672.1 porin [Ralstonia solanacearum]AXV88516.1 porin [Ralstonia solanacearum]AXW07991.1 porin [Ralstonia solanacearum]AXW25782.1 porin [Ralstonia solanacearum]AXW63955.1 porin [Ralstonia solanacearum]